MVLLCWNFCNNSVVLKTEYYVAAASYIVLKIKLSFFDANQTAFQWTERFDCVPRRRAKHTNLPVGRGLRSDSILELFLGLYGRAAGKCLDLMRPWQQNLLHSMANLVTVFAWTPSEFNRTTIYYNRKFTGLDGEFWLRFCLSVFASTSSKILKLNCSSQSGVETSTTSA